MLTNNHKEQAQILAKKHGKSINAKSSFSNLLKGKISKNDRPVDDKENEGSHVFGDLPSKCARSLNQSKGMKKNSPTSTPLLNTSFNGRFEEIEEKVKKSSPRQNIPQDSVNESIEKSSSFGIKPSNDYSEPFPLSLKITQSISTSQRSCMTEECYYQKELEIKVNILKKERDQLWDSITGIVKENQCLKDELAVYTMKEHQDCAIQTERTRMKSQGFQTEKQPSISSGFQTETAEINSEQTQTENTCIYLSTEGNQTETSQIAEICLQTDLTQQVTTSFQTDLTSAQMDQFSQRYQKALSQKREVLQFCETLYLQDISAELSDCLNMKDAISQYLSMKLDNLIKQFESQKTMLHRIYEEYINQFKKNEEQLQEKNQGLISAIQDNKIINKRLQENIQLCQQKICILQESNFILNNELMQAQEGLTQSKKQAELIKECLQAEKIRWELQKKLWEDKKTIYSNLLLESHRTVNGLMAQMKEFQEMASSNHYRHLQSQKHHQNVFTNLDI